MWETNFKACCVVFSGVMWLSVLKSKLLIITSLQLVFAAVLKCFSNSHIVWSVSNTINKLIIYQTLNVDILLFCTKQK